MVTCVVMVCADACAETWAHEGYTKAGNWTLGGDIRVRPEWSENMSNMGYGKFGLWNDYRACRERGRFWVKAEMDKKVSAYLRMTQEIRWGEDDSKGTPPLAGKEGRWAMLLDNAWLQVTEPFDIPVSFRVGRQDLLYGQGFLIVDSDSVYNGDGSRTYFFDAAKGTILLKAISTNIDFLYIRSHQGGDWNTVTNDEDLFGTYITSDYAKVLKGEAYLLIRDQGQKRTESLWAAVPMGIVHPKRKVYTWGGRLSGKLTKNFSVAAEGAAQTGHINSIDEFVITDSNGTHQYKQGRKGEVDIRAYGGYAQASYSFTNLPLKPSLMAGYWFYSGDDPDKKTWGGFDDLFSQAPIHGEYYLYSHLDLLSSPDSDWDPFLWSNMHFPKFQFSIVPYENFKFVVTYLHMFAHMNDLTFTDTQGGKDRADYVETTLQYTFSENLSAHVWYEWFIPGDYYSERAELGQYGRFEIVAKF